MRIKIIRIIIVGLFLTIASTLFYMQAIKGRYYRDLSLHNRIRAVALEGFRGRIKDRNGVILADNRKSFDVVIIPQDVEDLNILLAHIGQVLEASPEALLRRYNQKKATPFTPIAIAEDISQRQAIVLEESRYRYPSLIVQENFKRFYPLGDNSAHVLGYVGKINKSKLKRFKEYGFSIQSVVGYSGVEEYYDIYLKGEEGGQQIEVNSRGKQVRLIGIKDPTKGEDIALTIDSRVQTISSELLDNRPGVIIVMDTENGEILGMTSSPAFNPNIFVNHRLKSRSSNLFANPNSPLLNRAVNGAFPPGSVFKVPMALCTLDSKKTTQYSTFFCDGVYDLGGSTFGCAHKHGTQNLIEGITHSCNVYFYHLGMILGEATISRYAKVLGFGSPTHVDLPYEKSGLIPNRRQRRAAGKGPWYAGDTLNLSIGQGDVLTTPLQLVKMISTVSNEGVEVQPHLIRAISGVEDDRYNFVRHIKIDKKYFEIVKKGLRSTVTDYSGTANVLDLDGLYVAGKTGTAQTSKGKADHAWFVGYAKGNKKKLAFCVLLEHGGSSQNANLVARDLLTRLQTEEIL